MPSTASLKAGDAAPTPAAVALPRYEFASSQVTELSYAIKVVAYDYTHEATIGQKLVTIRAGEGNCTFFHSMTPVEARQLACALVDCANALDNPAERVIVNGPQEMHCGNCKHRADATHACDGLEVKPHSGCSSGEPGEPSDTGEGIGHE